jgi:hypothetical protein
MANPLRSLDDMMAQQSSYGIMPVSHYAAHSTTTTAATTTSGYQTLQRFPQTFTVPSLGSGVTNAYMGMYRNINGGAGTGLITMACLEVTLGTLTVSGNSYSDGSAMPSRTPYLYTGGSSQTLASMIPVAYISTTLSATTPVLTFNYTNEAGTTGRSSTVTLPTNAALNSAFLLQPYLQSGDSAIRDLSASSPNGLSISTGTSGVIKVVGLIPLAVVANSNTGQGFTIDGRRVSDISYPLQGGDVISFWRFGTASSGYLHSAFTLVPES